MQFPLLACQESSSFTAPRLPCVIPVCTGFALLVPKPNAAIWVAAQDQLQPLQDQIERIYGEAQVQLGLAAPSPETGGITPGASKVRVPHDLKPWDLAASANPSEFRRWKGKFEQYFLGSDLDVTHLPGQQAALSDSVNRELEQHLYNNISDNTPIFTPESNEDNIISCVDFIRDRITECHPLVSRRMELFKLP